MKKLILLTIIASVLFASCKKGAGPTPPPIVKKPDTTVDVYVTGSVIDGATSVISPAYWKNGMLVKLPVDAGIAQGGTTGIAISGNDIYISGYEGNDAPACYWKNGVLYKLSQPNPDYPIASTSSIAVKGNDVYVSGNFTVGYSGGLSNYLAAVAWKNGVPTILPPATSNGETSASGIALDGDDIYVCGSVEYHSNELPVYWKNNVLNKYAGDLYYGNANAITIDKSHNIYIAGTYSASSNPDPHSSSVCPAYWKNQTTVKLTITNPSASTLPRALSIAVDSLQNVYVGGYKGYWKNGAFVDIPTDSYTNFDPVNGIAFSGTNIYTTALLGNPDGSYQPGVYFKNNTPNALQGNNYSFPTGIAIVRHITN